MWFPELTHALERAIRHRSERDQPPLAHAVRSPPLLIKIIHKVWIVLLGGVWFWGPVTIVNLVIKKELDLASGTFLPLATLLFGYVLLIRNHPSWARSPSLWMLLGVYTTAEWFMAVGLMPTQGGFSQLNGWEIAQVWLAGLVYPFFTLEACAGYGTILAFLFAPLLLIVIHRNLERKPPANDMG